MQEPGQVGKGVVRALRVPAVPKGALEPGLPLDHELGELPVLHAAALEEPLGSVGDRRLLQEGHLGDGGQRLLVPAPEPLHPDLQRPAEAQERPQSLPVPQDLGDLVHRSLVAEADPPLQLLHEQLVAQGQVPAHPHEGEGALGRLHPQLGQPVSVLHVQEMEDASLVRVTRRTRFFDRDRERSSRVSRGHVSPSGCHDGRG